MDTNSAARESGSKQGLMRRWPVTTIAGLGGVASLVALVVTSSPIASAPQERAVGRAVVSPTEEVDERRLESKAGAPRAKAGLYAMRGPGDPAAAVDDGDAWGGLKGSEIGESYGVGGLGLVGTGRGGGGTGEGTIGLGFAGGSSGMGKGRYDRSLQSGVLTVGTVDDNADPSGYKKALKKLAQEREALGMPEDIWQLTPRAKRHDARPGGLDVALVVDTTGSMGDELEYLKVELRGIALEISKDFPDVDQRWGLVVYRDVGDDYVTSRSDFRDIDAFVAALGTQQAGGGGDTPEAMEAALEESSRMAWRADDATARLVFLVADAPTHEGPSARRFAGAVTQHHDAGTAIYPVGASGVDPQAEAQLRVAAHATGGQYIFLTDHSGVGDSHAAPKVDQFKVESLNKAMTRMIRQELGSAKGGPRSEPVPPPAGADVVVPMPEPPIEFVQKPAPMPMPESEPAPVVVVVAAAPEPAPMSLWEDIQQRLAEHLLFASSVAVLVFAAMGVDAFIARRRRMLRRG
jgi:Mg-chelatase subunit ChlD